MGAGGSQDSGEGGGPRNRLGEHDLIARYLAPLATHEGAFGLIDDAAALAPSPGTDLVATVDAVISGVHFLGSEAPALVARKALRVNLSDLAAKGARPLGYLLTLALPDDWSEDWLTGFCAGLAADQAEFGLSLLGGDTVRTPGPLSLSITALGEVAHGKMVPRRCARQDALLVASGTIGDGALGLMIADRPERAGEFGLSGPQAEELAGRYRLPRPRLGLRGALALAEAAMDISDGLVGDLAKMCRASGLDGRIFAPQVPLSGPARTMIEHDSLLQETALTGGDDYEILAAVAPENMAEFVARARAADIPVTEIGRLSPGAGNVEVLNADGRPMNLARAAYAHF